MAQYKLYYFNARGRAEPIRWIFTAAGQKFEDFRFEREKWPEFKSKSPTGQAPFLEVHEDGKVQTLAESISIARYLARKFGLAGKGDFEQAEVEMCGDKTSDLVSELVQVRFEKDETRKRELQHKISTETMPRILKFFDERLAKTGSGYLAASGLTWADLYLIEVLDAMQEKREHAIENFKNLKALDQKVRSHPKIAEWINSRPKTEF